MTDFGLQAQKAAEEHLARCNEALWDDAGDSMLAGIKGAVTDSPASAPYCGCDTCVVRETLHAAWPFLLLAAEEELTDGVRAEQEDQPDPDGDQRSHDVEP